MGSPRDKTEAAFFHCDFGSAIFLCVYSIAFWAPRIKGRIFDVKHLDDFCLIPVGNCDAAPTGIDAL